MIRFAVTTLLVASVLVVSSCGGGSSAKVQPPPAQPPPAPAPTLSITSISPMIALAGGPDLTLTVTGSGFPVGAKFFSQVIWSVSGNRTFLFTERLGNTQVTAIVPAALLKNPVTAQVSVQTVDQDGTPQTESNSLTFNVNVNSPSAVLPSLDTIGRNGVRQFVFMVEGIQAEATWAIEEGAAGGDITSSGLYSAPSEVGTYHVVATSLSDASKSATAIVSVVGSGFVLTGSMNKARSSHTAILLGSGKVLVVGGGDNTAELFDPTTNTFTFTGNMTTARALPSATLLASGKVLICSEHTAEIYDPESGTFTSAGNLAQVRDRHTATLLPDGRVLITGGIEAGAGGGIAVASAEVYDPQSGAFTLTGSMISARADHTATLLPNGQALVVGGWNGHAADASDDPPFDPLFAELFDPRAGSFTATGTMTATRVGHAAILSPGGDVFVLGGFSDVQDIAAFVERYNTASRDFSASGQLSAPRIAHTVTQLTKGKLLVVGGYDPYLTIISNNIPVRHMVDSVELYDLSSSSSSVTGGLLTLRSWHTATLLKDGRVLVTGGTDSSGNALASAELYQ